MDATEARRLATLAADVAAHARESDAATWNAKLEPDAERLEDVVRVLAHDGDAEAALTLAGGLSLFWQDIGKVATGRRVASAAVEGAPDSRSAAAARAHLMIGELAFRQGDQDVAGAETTLARDIAAEVGETVTATRAELNLARISFRDGDAARIFTHARRVLELAGDDLRLRSGGTHMLGWAEYTAGNLDAAVARFEENVENYRALGDRLNEASEIANLADLAMEAGDVEGARARLRVALDIPEAVESRYLAPSLIRSVGVLAGVRGEAATAVRLLCAAEELYRRYDLTPDPGDDVVEKVQADAYGAIGASAVESIRQEVAAGSLEEFVALARLELT